MLTLIIGIFVFLSAAMSLYMFYPAAEGVFSSWKLSRQERIAPKLDKMFVNIPYQKFILLDIVSPLVIGFVVFRLSGMPGAAVVSAFAGLAVSNLILNQMEKLRQAKFESQLVDGLMLLSGSLKAGLSLLQSFEALVEEMPAPISQEFGIVLRQNRMGIPLEDCLSRLKQRVPGEDLGMIISAILVSRETGGDLTTIFSSLVVTIRERSRLFGRVKALCTQGNIQGKIMMGLPVVFGLGVSKLNPELISVLTNDPSGRMLLIYAVVSEVIGIILITRFSKIEV